MTRLPSAGGFPRPPVGGFPRPYAGGFPRPYAGDGPRPYAGEGPPPYAGAGPRHGARARAVQEPADARRSGVFSVRPHPTGDGVVGPYVHTFDPTPRSPYHSHIPGMRLSPDASLGGGHQAATPIYDALYAEYRRSFKALPGDRTGEEDLRFRPFGGREHPLPWDRSGSWDAAPRGQHRASLPPALPPAQRDNRKHGM